jgi:hypothetical protein
MSRFKGCINHLHALLHLYPNIPWDWSGLSYNPNITMQFVLDHQDKPWDWWGLSRNPNISINDVLDYPDKSWNWRGLSKSQHNYAIRIRPSR